MAAKLSGALLLSAILLLACDFARSDFDLTILHTNDIHARFEQTNVYSGTCKDDTAAQGECYGGFARQYTKVQEIREKDPNVIFLNAGDYFQGTMWYTVHKWNVTAHFVNLINHTAMAIGNHEFDDGVRGVAPFLEAVECPIVAANMDASKEPNLQGKYNKSVVVTVGGKKIGIIGYITKTTPSISQPEQVSFTDEIEAIREEATKLRNEGVDIIIPLGHSGIDVDSQMAFSVPEVDVIVGGHSHTFLYTGTPPSTEEPVGDYPIVVTQATGKKVPIVQAYAFGKYLGYFKVKFDDNGEVISWSGSPILLDNSVPEDPNVLADLALWKKDVDAAGNAQVGTTRVFLDSSNDACGRGECNIGSLLADAMVDWFTNATNAPPGAWDIVSCAATNTGGIRSSIDELSGGIITVGDVLTVIPFENTIDVVSMKGKHIKQMFEYSTSRSASLFNKAIQGFLQVSGIHITFDSSLPVGSRVSELLIRCRECRVPEYLPVENEKVYWMAVNSFMYEGGDGYSVIAENAIEHFTGPLDSEVLIQYIKKISPVTQGLDGRIKFAAPKQTVPAPYKVEIHAITPFTAE